MNGYFKILSMAFIAMLALMSNTAFAGAEFSWTSPEGDKSLEYLGILFGPVGTALSGPAGGVLGTVMQAFNIAVLTLGSIVVGYTIIVSTINTAQEGEVMGRKWSSVWIPLRSAMGAAMLIPAPTYSLLQIVFMHITVLGIHAANQVWSITVNAFATVGMTGSVEVNIDDSAIKDNAVAPLFHSAVCAAMWNTTYDGLLPFDIAPYYNETKKEFVFGIAGNPYYENVCGGFKMVSSKPDGAFSLDSWQGTGVDILSALSAFMSPMAEDAAVDPLANTPGVVSDMIDIVKQGILNTPKKVATSGADSALDPAAAAANGWLFAGSFYFAFVGSQGTDMKFNNLPFTRVEPDISNLGDEGSRVYQPLAQLASYNYLNLSTIAGGFNDFGTWITGGYDAAPSGSDRLQLDEPSGLSSEGSQFVKGITGPLRSLAYKFMDHLTERFDDPIASIREVGAEIMIVCEAIWFGIMVIVFIVMIVTCIMAGMQPACFAVGSIVMVLISILSLLIALLWTIGASLGIYVPMIPYLVFTFTAIGWFILVIETLIAAPIVALGLVSPAQDVLGKAQPAVLLITGVFLRPSLMVVGFVASVFLVRTIIEMINFGFAATVEASISGIGIFGVLALIALYGGLVLSIIHECFSLVYVLPDKILRWIGGQVEQSSVGQEVKQMEKSVEKGAQMGGQLMKGTAAAAGSVAGMMMEGGGSKGGDKGDKGEKGEEGQQGDIGGEAEGAGGEGGGAGGGGGGAGAGGG